MRQKLLAQLIHLTGFILTKLSKLLGIRVDLNVFHQLGQNLDLTQRHGDLIFHAEHKTPYLRGCRLYSKEPDTIYWIDNLMKSGDVFFDIGANIGVYSLYAAQRGIRVFAFEPHSSSFDCLNHNVRLNNFSDAITTLPLSLHNQTGLSELYLSDHQSGKSGHAFSAPINQDNEPFEEVYRQSSIGYRLDELIEDFCISIPNHIKVDVDGNEPFVLEGLGRVLHDVRLLSLMIEGNIKDQGPVFVDLVLSAGFILLSSDSYRNPTYEKDGTRNYFFARESIIS
jgi:FkbM family methyltransferase